MSRVNEMENAADELRDMRLDIDGMSYEVNLSLFFVVYCCVQWNGEENKRLTLFFFEAIERKLIISYETIVLLSECFDQ